MPDPKAVLRLWFVVSTSRQARQLWETLRSEPRWGAVSAGLGTHGGQGDRLVVDFATTAILEDLGKPRLPTVTGGRRLTSTTAPDWLAALAVEKVIRPGFFELVYPWHREASRRRQRLFDGLPAAAATPLDVCAC